jgi:hypothetical protein
MYANTSYEDTHTNMSYDAFLVLIMRNEFIPMQGYNFRNDITKKLTNDYQICLNTSKGLLLTCESHNNILYESSLYYELDVSKIHANSRSIDILLEAINTKENEPKTITINPCSETVSAIKYDATNNLIKHIDTLNKEGLNTNNPWEYFDKHAIDIISFDDNRVKNPEYIKGNSWIEGLHIMAQRTLGYKK